MEGKAVADCSRAQAFDVAGTRLLELFQEIFAHDGYGSLEVNIRFLKRGQKEILLRCGKEYRFVADYPATESEATGASRQDQ